MSDNLEICTILDRMSQHEVLRRLTMSRLMLFINNAACLRRSIQLTQPLSEQGSTAPEHLPTSIAEFLSLSVGIPLQHLSECWSILKDLVWEQPTPEQCSEAQEKQFVEHGWQRGISELISTMFTSSSTQLSLKHPSRCTRPQTIVINALARMSSKKRRPAKSSFTL